MAMLAEPRQRKRYNLTPRGKALYEDDNRFGTKMLEKMGWSKGKGLGANEDGSRDFVRVRMRNTLEGLGYEDRDDHWTQHEQDFNGLLQKLTGENDVNDGGKARDSKAEASASDDEAPRVGFVYAAEPKKPKAERLKDKISGVSLEQKSKTSKARVHYQKFTKGKDIAQYSEKDLANIFGKKATNDDSAIHANGIYTQFENIMPPLNEVPVGKGEDKEIKPNFGGVQTISTGLSVSDYFKQKMEAMKNRNKQPQGESFEREYEQTVEDKGALDAKKKSKKRKRQNVEKDIESATYVESGNANDSDLHTALEPHGKKEKGKKKIINSEANELLGSTGAAIYETVCEINKENKTKKRDMNKTVDLALYDNLEVPTKKKKTKKDKDESRNVINDGTTMELIEESNTLFEQPKKTKKKKKAEREDQVGNTSAEIKISAGKREALKEEGDAAHHMEEPQQRKKSKKSKMQNNSNDVIATDQTGEHTTLELPTKTKKSKKDEVEPEEISVTAYDVPATQMLKRKKDKKSTDNEVLEKKKSKNKNKLVNELATEGEQMPNIESPQVKLVQPKSSEEETTAKLSKKLKKTKQDVSEKESMQVMTLDEIIAKYNSYNVYTISTFCAEKFRNADLDRFHGSNISHLPGYTHADGADIKLNIQLFPKDEKRITALWNCTINKYQHVNPKVIFHKYRCNVVHAYRNKQKRLPRLHMKAFKRKSIFQPI